MTRKSRPYKPSAAAIAMLKNMATPGLSPTDGLCGRSAHGGASRTWTALYRHGLRDENGITAKGYMAIAEAKAMQTGIACSDISSLVGASGAAQSVIANCNITIKIDRSQGNWR